MEPIMRQLFIYVDDSYSEIKEYFCKNKIQNIFLVCGKSFFKLSIAKYLKKIPLPSTKQQEIYFDSILSLVSRLESNDYMSQEWFDCLEELNQIVYTAYGITKKESEYIDSEVKRIQSKRWISDGQL